MKKRLFVFILSVCMLFSSCGGLVSAGNGNTSTPSNTQSEESVGKENSESNVNSESNANSESDSNSASDNEDSSSKEEDACEHTDSNEDGVCELCFESVLVTLDLYAVNDLHGKFTDSDTQNGVDELTTYLKNAKAENEYTYFLSSGDMWQGGAESNLTKGRIITDWMNQTGFSAMTLGNHEYDWGEEAVEINADMAEFPFLAINVYERATNERATYCQPSVMIEENGLKIGLIGAIGDCYSSISSDKVTDIYFKTGDQLTALVKAEALRLREAGADCIVYSLHDGYGKSTSGVQSITDSNLKSYYDIELSKGYVDVVFEGHSHQNYVYLDSEGVYHLQGGGDNDGVSHAELIINVATNTAETETAEFIAAGRYASLADDSIIAELLVKYQDEIALANKVVGQNSRYRSSTVLRNLVARLYYEKGVETWGNEYNIVLGGGFISVRSPYVLEAGQVLYGDLQSIFPFDNQIVLCRISGKKLKEVFLETTKDNYYMYYGEYGETIKDSVNIATAYYVVTDTYTSQYSWNGLTEIARLDETTFARDLLAEYINGGGLA